MAGGGASYGARFGTYGTHIKPRPTHQSAAADTQLSTNRRGVPDRAASDPARLANKHFPIYGAWRLVSTGTSLG